MHLEHCPFPPPDSVTPVLRDDVTGGPPDPSMYPPLELAAARHLPAELPLEDRRRLHIEDATRHESSIGRR